MRRTSFIIFAVLFVPAAASGQSTSSDSQTLQALLTEVHELRQELQSSLARVQTAQILIARLQGQQTVVAHATQRLDDMRSKLAETQSREKMASTNLKRLEDKLNSEDNPANQKQLQDVIDHVKSDLDSATNEDQQRQTAAIDAEQQLRIEQDKLDTLQAQLDQIVKSLDRAASQSGVAPN
jgi:chromosome segregation ATPase